AHQAHEGGRLAAGDDEAVEPAELLRLANLYDIHAETAQHRRVLAEIPLHCQNADLHALEMLVPRRRAPGRLSGLPAARLEQLFRTERGRRQPAHRIAETARHARE